MTASTRYQETWVYQSVLGSRQREKNLILWEIEKFSRLNHFEMRRKTCAVQFSVQYSSSHYVLPQVKLRMRYPGLSMLPTCRYSGNWEPVEVPEAGPWRRSWREQKSKRNSDGNVFHMIQNLNFVGDLRVVLIQNAPNWIDLTRIKPDKLV